MATTASKPSLQQQPQPYRWVILILMVVTFMLTFFIRLSWPPLIPVVVPILHMKMSQAGAFMSAFYIGYVITLLPAGMLADRFGARFILAASLIIEGITTAAMGSIGSFEQGFALRLITGLGAGAVIAAALRTLVDWFPPKERGTAFGTMLAGPSAGIVLSSVIVGPLNAHFGWQWAFRISGLIAFVMGFLIFTLVKSSGDEAKPAPSEGIFAGFPIVFKNMNVLLIGASGFCLMWVELGTATWAIAHVKKLGFTLAAAGAVMTAYGIGGIVAPFISGWISDRIGHRKWIIIVSYAVTVPMTVLFGMQTTISSLTVVGFIFGFTSYFANPHLSLLAAQFVEKKYVGLVSGATTVMYQIAPIIGPWVLGWSIDVTGKFLIVWWLMALGPLVGILTMLPVNEKAQILQ
jgi:sugar phosphate permease